MSDLHREEKQRAIRILDRLHRECSEENGNHPDERDTAFSYGADGIRREMTIPTLIAQARREALEEALKAADRAHRDTCFFVTYPEHRAHNKAVDEVYEAILSLLTKETRHD